MNCAYSRIAVELLEDLALGGHGNFWNELRRLRFPNESPSAGIGRAKQVAENCLTTCVQGLNQRSSHRSGRSRKFRGNNQADAIGKFFDRVCPLYRSHALIKFL